VKDTLLAKNITITKKNGKLDIINALIKGGLILYEDPIYQFAEKFGVEMKE
jgi:hypothetical protein